MKIQRAYQAELNPTGAQREQFLRHCGTARFAFNWALARKIAYYQETGKTLPYREVDAEFNRMKLTEFSWAYEVSKWSHQSAIRDCERAFKNFFAGLKSGPKVGFPKFKSKHRSMPKYRVPGEAVKIEAHFITLPKIGRVKFRRYGYVPASGVKINSVTISRRAGRWFVSVQVEEEIAVPENQGPAIGLDMGLLSFCVGSDGSRVAPPKSLARSLKKLRRLSRSHSRKVNGSQNRRKATDRLAKLHFRVANQRADYLHKLSHHYATKFRLICIEDLHVSGMIRNRHLSRAIGDCAWGEFHRQLGYKTVWYGSELVEADRWYPSTKTCSACGHVRDALPLSVRIWICDCGTIHERDFNASVNLEHYGRSVVAGRTGSQESTPVEITVG